MNMYVKSPINVQKVVCINSVFPDNFCTFVERKSSPG